MGGTIQFNRWRLPLAVDGTPRNLDPGSRCPYNRWLALVSRGLDQQDGYPGRSPAGGGAQLEQRGVRVLGKVTLGKKAQPQQLRVDVPQVGEIRKHGRQSVPLEVAASYRA